MKKLVVLVLLAAGLTSSLLDAKQDFPCHKKNICCDPKPLPEPDVEGFIFITESGAYKLTKSITADITIDAHDVCLDLNCFTLTGTGISTNAITGSDLNNIIIKNGTIKNPGKVGITLLGCNQILLENLKLNPVNIAIVIDESINNITSNSCLKDIDVSGNSIVAPGIIISIRNGHTFSLTRINASDCIIQNRPSFIEALVDIEGVDNVTMSCSKINRNECRDRRLFIPLSISEGDNISVEDTEVNDNKVTFQGLSAGMIDTFLGFGSNYCIKRCQFNRSTVLASTICYGLASLLISDLFVDCSEANGTTLTTADVTGPLSFILGGATGIFIALNQGFTIHNSEANGTTQTTNIPPQTEFSGPEGIFLLASTRGAVEKCQANRTFNGTNSFIACGLLTFFCKDIVVCKCEARHTSAANAFGFAAIAPNIDVTISDSIGSDTTGTTLAAGFVTLPFFVFGPPLGTNVNVSFKNDCAQNNLAPQGFGFVLAGDTIDCSVCDSQAQGNSTAGIQVGLITGDNHVNPRIVRNCAQENKAGIVIFSPTPQTVANALVFENKAIKNTNCGFQEIGTPAVPTTYLGNKAQGNGIDFCGITNFEVKKKDVKLCCEDKSDKCDSDDLANVSICPKRTI